jgi:hypothetical protein
MNNHYLFDIYFYSHCFLRNACEIVNILKLEIAWNLIFNLQG